MKQFITFRPLKDARTDFYKRLKDFCSTIRQMHDNLVNYNRFSIQLICTGKNMSSYGVVCEMFITYEYNIYGDIIAKILFRKSYDEDYYANKLFQNEKDLYHNIQNSAKEYFDNLRYNYSFSDYYNKEYIYSVVSDHYYTDNTENPTEMYLSHYRDNFGYRVNPPKYVFDPDTCKDVEQPQRYKYDWRKSDTGTNYTIIEDRFLNSVPCACALNMTRPDINHDRLILNITTKDGTTCKRSDTISLEKGVVVGLTNNKALLEKNSLAEFCSNVIIRTSSNYSGSKINTYLTDRALKRANETMQYFKDLNAIFNEIIESHKKYKDATTEVAIVFGEQGYDSSIIDLTYIVNRL